MKVESLKKQLKSFNFKLKHPKTPDYVIPFSKSCDAVGKAPQCQGHDFGCGYLVTCVVEHRNNFFEEPLTVVNMDNQFSMAHDCTEPVK